MKYEQSNWTLSNDIEITHTVNGSTPLVCLSQNIGACSLHFAMNTFQAHQMAQKLIDIANTAEACQELADKAKARAMDVEAEKA